MTPEQEDPTTVSYLFVCAGREQPVYDMTPAPQVGDPVQDPFDDRDGSEYVVSEIDPHYDYDGATVTRVTFSRVS